MERVDLHTHTTASDGKNSPTQNVELAVEKGLRAIAITDHDTVAGVEEAVAAADRLGIEVIPGIEVSTVESGLDIHVLGYFIDYSHPELETELEQLRDTRRRRNQMLIDRLNRLGIGITMEEVQSKQRMKGGNVGRPHIAEVLMEKGRVDSLQEAFDQYLGKTGKAYVNPPRISAADGVSLIQRFNGIAVLAHPGLYGRDDIIEPLVARGLQGIEVYHPDHSTKEIDRYKQLASRYQLVATGGSDYHGKRNGRVYHGELGSQPVDRQVLEQLKAVRVG